MRGRRHDFITGAREVFDFYRRGATVAPPRRESDRSRWRDRAIVFAHLGASVWVLARIATAAPTSVPHALTAAVFVCLGHLAVDPTHALVHFAIDNYLSRSTSIIGDVVDGFLTHHEQPALITRIQLARNVAPFAALSLPALVVLIVASPAGIGGLAALSFLGTFFVENGVAIEAHKYAHIAPRALPAAIRWLQRRGWLIDAAAHAGHHARRPGHEADYATVTGRANNYLTPAFFRRLERAILALTRSSTGTGVEPRSWRDRDVRAAAFPPASSAGRDYR